MPDTQRVIDPLKRTNLVDHWDKDKTKSHNPFFTNASQPQTQTQTQAFKKDKYHQGSHWGYLAIEVNIIEVAKKNKDKVKDLNHIKCYIGKQKDHYTNKYFEKPKNKWQPW